MEFIKSFIYLDEYKMYSVLSQLSEGLTDHMISYSFDHKAEEEEQKGPVASGRKFADLLVTEKGTKETRFLHDYSYTLFEKKIVEDNRALLIDYSNFESLICKINDYNFIKVSGRCVFYDFKNLSETMEQFNKIGEALTYITTVDSRQSIKRELNNNDLKNIKLLQAELKRLSDTKKLAQEMGLAHDNELLNNMVYLLRYGYKDHFEIQIPIPGINDERYIFSCILKRELLKENEELILKKYSRTSEKLFTIFGLITQSKLDNPEMDKESESPMDSTDMRKLLLKSIIKMSALENTFIAKWPNEIIIDPIALYREI